MTLSQSGTRSGDRSAAASGSAPGQYLTFDLAGQSYGLDLLRVREIRGLTPITSLPEMPRHVAGVINLRGVVVPVVNLRRRFNLPDAELTRHAVFIVVDLGLQPVGLLVDAVSDVVTIAAEQIGPPPDLAEADAPALVQALARLDDRIVGLLNIENSVAAHQPWSRAPNGLPARANERGSGQVAEVQ